MSTDTRTTETFAALGVPAPLIKALAERGITTPTPIQAATVRDSLAGRDVLGRGRTGSGKTLAFVLPMLARLAGDGHGQPRQARRPRGLILVPTRELATQVAEVLTPLASQLGLNARTVFGGVGQTPQVEALRRGVDVVIACPGRLEDLMRQGHVSLDRVEITVLDEADHMADLGFLPAVRRLLAATPKNGQRMLFSATLDAAVGVIVKAHLNRPVTHEADDGPVAQMTHHVLHVSEAAHLPVLLDLTAAPGRSVVFTRTKHRAKQLAKKLNAAGVPAVELHGNLSQAARARTMAAFHSGTASTLVATDIAARGIHVDDVALVIHADPPMEYKAYLHRSGRTARAGATGTVVTLMTDAQRGAVRTLTRQAGVEAAVTKVHVGHSLLSTLAPGERVLRPDLVASNLAATSAATASGSGSGRPRASTRAKGSGQPRREVAPSERGRRSGGAAGFSSGSRSGTRRSRTAVRSTSR